MFIITFILILFLQPAPLTIVSPDFANEGRIPVKFTCDGEDVNPTLIVNGAPEGTRSLALIVEDPDAALTTFTQWIVWNIPPTETIGENTVPGTQGMNTLGKNPYRGPCPVTGTQRYVFRVYALDRMLNLKSNAGRSALEEAMEGHVLATGELVGEYDRAVVADQKKKK
jgi:Raf kinase inhibitor-like YbhB/YbcL family protein